MMTKLKVNLGDFELMQLILKAFDFECVSNDESVYKKIYRKNNVDVVITKYNKDRPNIKVHFTAEDVEND